MTDRRTDRQTDIFNCRVAFATEKHLRDQDIGIMADRHDSERLRGFGD